MIHINAPEGCRFVLSFHGHLCQARPDFIDIPRPGIQPETDSLVFILVVLGRRPRLRPIVAAAGPLGEAVEGSPLRLLGRGPTAGPPPRAAAGCGVGRGALAGAAAFAFLLCGPCAKRYVCVSFVGSATCSAMQLRLSAHTAKILPASAREER